VTTNLMNDDHNVVPPSRRDQQLNAGGLILGVDGGGSKTVAWLGRWDGQHLECIGKGRGGPSNLQAVGHETALKNIQQSINLTVEQAFSRSTLLPGEVASACLCLAGAGRQAEQDIILNWARQIGLATQVRLVGEAEAVLAAVTEPCPADCADVALICGTGSLAWGLRPDRIQSQRCGGWGYLLGDEGSGFWLGQQLLQLACREADGRRQDTNVLGRVLTELQLQSADQLVGWTYQQSGQRERIASLAKLIFRESDFGDPSKAEITKPENHPTNLILRSMLQQGASEMATMVVNLVRQLDAKHYRLTMAGSVLCHQAEYRNLVEQQLTHRSLPPTSIQRVEHPVAGALQLAFRMMEEES